MSTAGAKPTGMSMDHFVIYLNDTNLITCCTFSRPCKFTSKYSELHISTDWCVHCFTFMSSRTTIITLFTITVDKNEIDVGYFLGLCNQFKTVHISVLVNGVQNAVNLSLWHNNLHHLQWKVQQSSTAQRATDTLRWGCAEQRMHASAARHWMQQTFTWYAC